MNYFYRGVYFYFSHPLGGKNGIQPRGKNSRKKSEKMGKEKKRKKRDKRGKKREGKKNYVKRRRNILSLYFESGKENLKDISAW